MTEPYITAAWLIWLATLSREESPDIEQAFAAGYRAASVPPIIREAFANEKAKEEAEHAGLTTSTVAAWRYKDHGDDRWSFSDGPDGVAMADIIEPLFPLGAAGYLQGIEAAARFHEERAIAIRTDAASYKNGRIDRSAYQASNFHEQAAMDIRKLKDPDNAS